MPFSKVRKSQCYLLMWVPLAHCYTIHDTARTPFRVTGGLISIRSYRELTNDVRGYLEDYYGAHYFTFDKTIIGLGDHALELVRYFSKQTLRGGPQVTSLSMSKKVLLRSFY